MIRSTQTVHPFELAKAQETKIDPPTEDDSVQDPQG